MGSNAYKYILNPGSGYYMFAMVNMFNIHTHSTTILVYIIIGIIISLY